MRCDGCGLSNFEGATSCRRCGTILVTGSGAPPPPSVTPSPAPATPSGFPAADPNAGAFELDLGGVPLHVPRPSSAPTGGPAPMRAYSSVPPPLAPPAPPVTPESGPSTVTVSEKRAPALVIAALAALALVIVIILVVRR